MQCQIVVFLLWSETLRHVEPRGSPRSFADEWVEGTNPASLYHSADTLAMHLPDKWCSNTTIHVVTEQPREQRDYYLGITWVVKTPDNNSVQEQCSMNNKIDFDLWVNVYDCDEWFLDWILMIALKRQKCFHLQKWESIIAGESLKLGTDQPFIVSSFSNSLVSLWPRCRLIQTFWGQVGCRVSAIFTDTHKVKAVWPKLQPEVIQRGFVLDSCSLSSWLMEYKSKTFFSLQQSVKDSHLKKSDFPSQGDFLCAFNQSVSLGNYFL